MKIKYISPHFAYKLFSLLEAGKIEKFYFIDNLFNFDFGRWHLETTLG